MCGYEKVERAQSDLIGGRNISEYWSDKVIDQTEGAVGLRPSNLKLNLILISLADHDGSFFLIFSSVSDRKKAGDPPGGHVISTCNATVARGQLPPARRWRDRASSH